MQHTFSYDYTRLLKEMKTELRDRILRRSSTIYILRGEPLSVEHFGMEFKNPYRPIIDWFYKRSQAKEAERDQLEEITVGDLLVEIKTWNRIV